MPPMRGNGFFLLLGLFTCIAGRAEDADRLTVPLAPDQMLQGVLGVDPDARIRYPASVLRNRRKYLKAAYKEWEPFEKALSFPCDLKKARSLPSLELQGECHDDSVCMKCAGVFAAQANGGKCVLATEGYNPGDTVEGLANSRNLLSRFSLKSVLPTARIVGFDDSYLHGFGLLLLSLAEHREALLLKKEFRAFEERLNVLIHIPSNPYLIKTLTTLATKELPADPSQRAITEFLFSAKNDTAEGLYKRLSLLPEEHALLSKPKAFEKVLAHWVRAYVELVRTKEMKEKLPPPHLEDIVEDFIAGEDPFLAIQIIAVDWRNIWMAKNILKLYCDNLDVPGKANVPFHAIVGLGHVGGMHRILSHATRDSGVSFKVTRSKMEDDQ